MAIPLTQENLRRATATSNNTPKKVTIDPFAAVCREVRTFLKTEGNKAAKGAFIYFEYLDDPDDPVVIWGDANDGRPRWVECKKSFFWPHQAGYPRPTPPPPPPPPPPPKPQQTLGFSPIACVDTPPSPPPPPPQQPQQIMGFSPILCTSTPPVPPPTREKTKPKQKTRKGRKSTSPKKKTKPPGTTAGPSAPPAPAPAPATPSSTTPTTEPASTSTPAPAPAPRQRTQTPTKHGIVIHGVALNKDLGKVRRWLETDNQDLGKTTGIRWLRKETLLREEGKKTSSVVVYTQTMKEAGKVRLGGRWLRTEVYEPNRGRS